MKTYTCPICDETFGTLEGMQHCIAQHEEDVAWFERHYSKEDSPA